MQLILESTKVVENPASGEIGEALPTAKFAVLAGDPDFASYIQFMRSRKRGIELEYQVGSLENHFGAAGASITIERVIVAFQKYASGDDSWKTDFQWEHLGTTTVHGQKVLVTREWMRKANGSSTEP